VQETEKPAGGQEKGAGPVPSADKEALSNPELFEAYEESMGELSDADNAASAGGPAV
jgi:hypothetical protein